MDPIHRHAIGRGFPWTFLLGVLIVVPAGTADY
jgi:hypothetical protein